MAVVEYSDEIKLNVSPKRLFKALVIDAHNFLPKAVPHIFKSVHVLEGEGGVAGCVRQINFPDGAPFSHMKDKLEAVDTENLTVKLVLSEGPGLGEKMESLHAEQKFVDSGDGGCIIKMKNHHHLKAGHTHIAEEEFKAAKEHGITFFTATEAYLIAHPDVYN
ncbi:pathogenesis-related protein STH-21-like [Dorcoceras hygrometricum]|uniref:Pathogenesis-related protein STH-21-like n=1 Tax=Dorcoceras hygrometricum TaxID=472368 RepID=A0A2Z7CYB8_9LAMI|nr:pathogenesis-related protein STH-21-like [Dorcoceras hygrometricum]